MLYTSVTSAVLDQSMCALFILLGFRRASAHVPKRMYMHANMTPPSPSQLGTFRNSAGQAARCGEQPCPVMCPVAARTIRLIVVVGGRRLHVPCLLTTCLTSL